MIYLLMILSFMSDVLRVSEAPRFDWIRRRDGRGADHEVLAALLHLGFDRKNHLILIT